MTSEQAWLSPQWQVSVEQWLKEQLTKNGIQPQGSLQKVSGWSLGHIYRQATNQGDVYFKATANLPLFSNEAQLCQKLSQLLPEHVPDTLASCGERQWMISKDFGGGLPEDSDLSLWQAAFKQFSRLQLASIEHSAELVQSGCLSREINELPEQLGDALNDSEITDCIPEAVLLNRESILAKVTNSVKQLADFAIPSTLVHGDLHIENIAGAEDGFIFFDWSDACISHPFIDGTYIFRMPDSDEKQQIIKAYLSNWQEFAPMAELNKAWQLAEIVCYAHQAVSYASMKKSLPAAGIKDLEQAFINAFKRLLTAAKRIEKQSLST